FSATRLSISVPPLEGRDGGIGIDRTGGRRGASEDPGVLGPAPLRAVDDQAPSGEGDPGQAAGQDLDFFAVEDERAKVDMPPFQMLIDVSRVLAEADRGLTDVPARVVRDLPGELLALLGGRGGADQHPVPARTI